MFDSELPAEKKLTKARAQLIMDDPFFGSMAMRLIIEEDADGSKCFHKTICTDGRHIWWNRKYIDSLEVTQVKTEIAHEVGHIVLKHHTRRKKRKPGLWNKAGDQAVDAILEDAGYKLPDGIVVHQQFKGKATEEIYALMDQQGEGEGENGQYGQHGEVVDAPINLNDVKEVQTEEENITIAVEQAAKLAGNLPGSLKDLVEANKHHQISYHDLLREFLDTNLTPGDYDWTRPDRTYLQQDLYVPGLADEEELPKILFITDSSGSVGRTEKQIYSNEVSGVLSEFPCKIRMLCTDTKVQNDYEVDSDDFPLKLHFDGGGGTNFTDVFRHIKDQGYTEDAKAILFFTDLCTSSFGEDPGIPVLWMNTYRSNDNAEVPFGKVIPLEIDPKKLK